jgi:alpha-galactosidase
MLDFARDIEAVCPNAWLLNYANPVAIVTGAVQRATAVRTVGLCHSVQVCARAVLQPLGLWEKVKTLRHRIAGINHQAWLLEIADGGKDLYPEIKRRAAQLVRDARAGRKPHPDAVRMEIMLRFGYYLTESSEHSAEYVPWFIKAARPELIEQYGIPLDEYPRRCEAQIAGWQAMRGKLVQDTRLTHRRTHEYASWIMEAMETDRPFRIGGNVPNTGLITNLPRDACVEVPCLVDRNGVQGTFVGDLPPQCAALNRTNVNVQLLTIEAALTGRRDHVYQAAMLDPHTAAELTIDDIVGLCDDLIEAHGELLPPLR